MKRKSIVESKSKCKCNVNLVYSGHALSYKSTKHKLVYRHATETKEANSSNKRNIVKNPSWQDADQLAIYKA